MTNAGALAEGKSQGCAVSPPGYCHGSEWLIGNETRAGDCAVMAAELCPRGCVVRCTRAALCGTAPSCLHTCQSFQKAGQHIYIFVYIYICFSFFVFAHKEAHLKTGGRTLAHLITAKRRLA